MTRNSASRIHLNRDGIPFSIVARECSELAQRLTAQGWIARSGWVSTGPDTRGVWLIRFEHPTLSLVTSAA
jgi:hypothetical protein